MISFSGRKGKGRVSMPMRGHGNPIPFGIGMESGGWGVVCVENI